MLLTTNYGRGWPWHGLCSPGLSLSYMHLYLYRCSAPVVDEDKSWEVMGVPKAYSYTVGQLDS